MNKRKALELSAALLKKRDALSELSKRLDREPIDVHQVTIDLKLWEHDVSELLETNVGADEKTKFEAISNSDKSFTLLEQHWTEYLQALAEQILNSPESILANLKQQPSDEKKAGGMKIFLSWSGLQSHAVALALKQWLHTLNDTFEAWLSSKDIAKGSRWGIELASNLEQTSFGIICLTPGISHEPWINFEAGALSKQVSNARVCPLLINCTSSELSEPLSQFQATLFTKDEILTLVDSISNAANISPAQKQRARTVAEYVWPNLENEINSILKNHRAPSHVSKTASSDPFSLTPEEESILKLMTTTDERAYPETVVKALKFSIIKSKHYLDELKRKGFLDYNIDREDEIYYYFESKARELAVQEKWVD